MKILMLAPHPFYQGRGTPIDADLVLKVLSQRGEHIDMLTYSEGTDVEYPNLKIYRTPALKFLTDIRPGFSGKKVICDCFLLMQAIKLVKKTNYDLIHAGEEAVFIALLIQKFLGIPYVYDMDSSLVGQLIDKYPYIKRLKKVLQAFERVAVQNAAAVVPVCQALASGIEPHKPAKVAVLPDISLLNTYTDDHTQPPIDSLKKQFDIVGTLLMYVGNLESYQGIDLLLESFAQALRQEATSHLVVVGGKDSNIQKYQAKARDLNIASQVHFIGPRPIEQLRHYLAQADIVVSPRVQGQNTPMKLYSYLDSGVALLATNLTTHTQVLSDQMAWLAEPEPTAFATGMAHLIAHPDLRASLGKTAQAYIAQEHTYEVFSHKLNTLYDWLQNELPADLMTSSIV